MKKISKIIFVMINLIAIFGVEVFAKYNYVFKMNAYSLTRDNSEITYTLLKSVEEPEYTNKDITLTINLSKPIYEIDGFKISEDKKTLTKVFSENETNTIVVEDISGNKKEIEYSVNNIDKIPPEIIGVENGKTYNSNVTLSYTDNVGVKDIKVDKYSSLGTNLHDDYYDTSFFKGIDLTDTTAQIRVTGHPKNTQKYRYYINNVLKSETTETAYKFTGLKKGTNYTIKIEAVDGNGKVLQTVTRNIKTKMFSKVEGTKTSTGSFKLTVTGIDSSVSRAVGVSFTSTSNKVSKEVTINSNRTATVNFSAQEVTGSLQTGYYYFHIQLFNPSNGLIDTVCCNVIFNQNYTPSTGSSSQNLYNLTSNGNYQIIVTDLAGNKSEKTIVIQK